MVEGLAALAGAAPFLLIPAAIALAVLHFARPPAWMLLPAIGVGTLGVPSLLFLVGEGGSVPMVVVFFFSLLGVYAVLRLVSELVVRAWRDAGDATVARSTVFYLLSSILWFGLLYWSGSAIEGLHFAVSPAIRGATDPPCILQPQFICNHLTIVQALQISAGNLLTVGAAGITPLDDIGRLFALLQMVPVFVAANVLVRR